MAAKDKFKQSMAAKDKASIEFKPSMAVKDKGCFFVKKDVLLEDASGDHAVKPPLKDRKVREFMRRTPGLPSVNLVEDYLLEWRGFTTGPKELLIREEKTVPLPVAYGSLSSKSHEFILPKRGESANTDILHNLPESTCKIPGQDESLVSDEESLPQPCAVPRVKFSRLHELPVTPQSETGIPAKIVITFVNEMERAHQYFKLVEYLFCKIKPDMDPRDVDDIAYELGMQNYDAQEFNLLDIGDIWHAVKCYSLELITCREMEGLTDKVLDNDPYTFKNPIFYIVFRTLKKGYVLDEDPRAELEKLQRYTPTFYRDSLVCPEPHVEREGRTVMVSNISPDVSGKDIWKFFRAGGSIEHVETHRVLEGQRAYITFKKQSGAKYAQNYMDVGVPYKLCLKGVPLLVEPVALQNAKGSKSTVEKAEDTSTMLAKARNKYSELKIYYSQIQRRSIVPQKDEGSSSAYEDGGVWDPSLVKDECWDDCEWMHLEALANGGFTVGGQSLLHPPEVA